MSSDRSRTPSPSPPSVPPPPPSSSVFKHINNDEKTDVVLPVPIVHKPSDLSRIHPDRATKIRQPSHSPDRKIPNNKLHKRRHTDEADDNVKRHRSSSDRRHNTHRQSSSKDKPKTNENVAVTSTIGSSNPPLSLLVKPITKTTPSQLLERISGLEQALKTAHDHHVKVEEMYAAKMELYQKSTEKTNDIMVRYTGLMDTLSNGVRQQKRLAERLCWIDQWLDMSNTVHSDIQEVLPEWDSYLATTGVNIDVVLSDMLPWPKISQISTQQCNQCISAHIERFCKFGGGTIYQLWVMSTRARANMKRLIARLDIILKDETLEILTPRLETEKELHQIELSWLNEQIKILHGKLSPTTTTTAASTSTIPHSHPTTPVHSSIKTSESTKTTSTTNTIVGPTSTSSPPRAWLSELKK